MDDRDPQIHDWLTMFGSKVPAGVVVSTSTPSKRASVCADPV